MAAYAGERSMKFHIQDIEIGGNRPFYILGPCSLESEDFAWQMAHSLKEVCVRVGVKFIFKSSYDKANRTSAKSFRGPGLEEGCRILSQIGQELQIPVVTDVHTEEQAEYAAQYVDLLQV